ncbi:inter-alpha-trypsin inhibitor heavy chain H5, partial [Leptonychotes weddellii]|uniref:Inter-alpha-trypsin inhibitor heavy chain H5 n=1 Tax=Leptonychotes weddellii TaxID=9713 RepID=A0A2U3Z1L6_LEPWE
MVKTKPLMTEFSVKSTIISRYAFTTVSCRMLNRASEDQEIEFQMQIPAAAFITNFTLLIGDKVYQGEITGREKKNGDKVKEKRNKTSEDNGEKGTDMFRASIVIPSKDKAAFLLSYEELLQRRLGKYEHVISVRPQQLVGRLMVEVNILERSGIESLEVLPLQHSQQKDSGRGKGECDRRVSCANSERGVGFREIYKTEGTPSTKAPRAGKNLRGSNTTKTKDALFRILHDLRPQDHFNIIGFSNRIKVWKDHLVSVTPDSVRDGKVYIHHMSPTGGTDINGALQRGIKLLNDYVAHNDIEDHSVSLIIFLTDGKPTVGETHTLKILNNTKEAARGQICIFTIGIGDDVDFMLLEKLSLENCGLTRRVLEEDDAGSQLIGFYDEIRTPLLSDIRVDYPPASVEHATRTVFPNYFNGSEIVTAGKLADSQAGRLHVEVTASNSQRFVLLKTDVPLEPHQAGRGGGAEGRNHVERLWSYLTLKELLSSWRHSGDEREKQRLGQSARTLAVARGFLTPLTALHLRRRALQTQQLEDAR